jgi:hypothetical protein
MILLAAMIHHPAVIAAAVIVEAVEAEVINFG